MEDTDKHREMARSRPNLTESDQDAISIPSYQVPRTPAAQVSRLWWFIAVLGAFIITASLLVPWQVTAQAAGIDATSGKLKFEYDWIRGIETQPGVWLVPIVLVLGWWLGLIQHKRTLLHRDYLIGWSLVVCLWVIGFIAIITMLSAFSVCAGCINTEMSYGILCLPIGILILTIAMVVIYVQAMIRKKQTRTE